MKLIPAIFRNEMSHSEGKNSFKRPELELGKSILVKLLELFDIKKIVAVGRKPEAKLRELGIECNYVRHPGNGGKPEFVEGIRSVFSILKLL